MPDPTTATTAAADATTWKATTRSASPTTRRLPSSPWWPTLCRARTSARPTSRTPRCGSASTRELLDFKEKLLADTSHALDTISAAGREEVAKTDAVILDAEAQRFRQRLALWKQRCAELAPGP